MTPERWRQIETLFDAVAELHADARSPHLDVACAGDPELRAEVESLLASLPGAPTRLRAVIGQEAAVLAAPTLVGRHFGPYRVVREIGEGGMGVVFLAERDDGEYRTRVAIKLLRGIRTAQAAARFRDERQILATLEHPGIVRLLDGGSTEEGQPYLVMEYVEGLPITRFVETRQVPLRARLELFCRVAAAVAHAHQRLVVHRDLKPSNILVTPDGTPKLLDFGIAKLLDTEADREARTRTGMPLLTPEYASPEQVRGEPVSTATDIYSLGAVLYELCTGVQAQQLAGTGIEALRTILEVDPPRPSSVGPPPWRRALTGDLDNMILKALQKAPERRYASVERLMEDVRRHLEGLPVEARAATFLYRAEKFVRRNLGLVAATAAVFGSLTAATVVSLDQARRADEQAQRADAEAQRAQRRFTDVRRLANSLLFEVDEAIRDLPGSTAARELIVRRALEYLDGLAAESGDEPALARELAAAYMKIGDIQGSGLGPNLGRPREGLVSYGKARQILERLAAAGPSDPETRLARARVDYGTGSLQWAERDGLAARASIEAARRLVEGIARDGAFDHRLAIGGCLQLMEIESWLGDTIAASRTAGECRDSAEQWARIDASPEARYFVAAGHSCRGFFAGEGQAHREAVRILEELVAQYPDNAVYKRELAYAIFIASSYLTGMGDATLWVQGEYDLTAGERELRRAASLVEGLVAQDDRDMRMARLFAEMLSALGLVVAARAPAEAVVLLERARALFEGLPAATRETRYTKHLEWFTRCALAEPLALVGRRTEALAEVRAGLVLAEQLGAAPDASLEDRLHVMMCRYQGARMHRALGEAEVAATMLHDLAAELERMLAAQPAALSTYIGLTDTLELLATQRPTERCPLLRRALAAWIAWPGAPTPTQERRTLALERALADCPATK